MRPLLLAVVWVLSDLDLIFGIDWCSLDCRDGTKNTMCTYQPQQNIDACVNIREVMTPADRAVLLELHNQYRNNLAGGKTNGWPKAANMRRMSWDSDLETVALRWAVQCKPGHDKCRRSPTFDNVGQNYAMTASSGEFPNFNSSFIAWVGEITMLTPAAIDSFVGGQWGHFTQVIWAESYKLGCGLINYEEGGFKKVVLICNYGPSGNFLTRKIYEKGEPCSQMPCKDPKYPYLATGDGETFEDTTETAEKTTGVTGQTTARTHLTSAARSGKNFPPLLITMAVLIDIASTTLSHVITTEYIKCIK